MMGKPMSKENIEIAPVAGFSGMPTTLLRLAFPTIAGTISYTLMQFIDGWMLSLVDRQEGGHGVNLAAAFNGGITVWVLVSACVGVAGVINTLSAQSIGRQEFDAPARFTWQGLWLAAGSVAVFLPLIALVPWWFTLLGHHNALLHLETLFAAIMLAIAPLNFASSVLGNFFLGIHRPIHQFTAGIIGNVINLILDWILIFGHFGAPAMGLLGAALATSAATAISLGILLGIFFSRPYRRVYHTHTACRLDFKKLWQVLRIGLPSGIQSSSDILCWAIFSLAWVDHFGAAAAEAQSAVMRYLSLSFMPAVGMSMAACALVGRRIGQGDATGAQAAARWAVGLSVAYMGVCGLIFFMGRGALAGFMLGPPAQRHVAGQLLIFSAIFQIFDAMNIVYLGALRGAGDTLVPTLYTTALAWGLCVCGGGLVMWREPQWGPAGPWALATAYVCICGLWSFLRWNSQAWRKFNVLGDQLYAHAPR
jgi:MATE family multidrug resistance protein